MDICLPLLKPAQLFVRIDLQPELEQHSSKMYQLLFHRIDLSIRPSPLRFSAEPFNPLDQDTAIPRPIEDRDVPSLWQLRPKSPEIMMCLLDVIRSGDRDYLVSARIQI